MTEYFLPVTAFTLGFLGSPHCAGMCGGIIGVLHTSIDCNTQNKMPQVGYGLAFNGGRLLSYSVVGMIAATLGSSLIALIGVERSHLVMQMTAGTFMLLLGLSIASWWSGLSRIESIGYQFWRRLQPLTSRLIPIRSKFQALLLGALWGWLPCGLIYSALLLVMASGNALQGGLTMFAFGLGTLPMMALLGLSAGKINQWRANPKVRSVMGIVIIVFGIVTFLGLLDPILTSSEHNVDHSHGADSQSVIHD